MNMTKENKEIVASNLTAAFYNGQVRREPFLGEDKRIKFYSPEDHNRIPTISMKEVYSVYRKFCEMVEGINNAV
jgi:hypothetical protein